MDALKRDAYERNRDAERVEAQGVYCSAREVHIQTCGGNDAAHANASSENLQEGRDDPHKDSNSTTAQSKETPSRTSDPLEAMRLKCELDLREEPIQAGRKSKQDTTEFNEFQRRCACKCDER